MIAPATWILHLIAQAAAAARQAGAATSSRTPPAVSFDTPIATRDRGGLWQGGTPFVDPMDLHDVWWLSILPLALLISMAYKGIRTGNLDRYWQEVSVMTAQLIVGIVAAAAGIHILLEYIIPAIS